VIGVTGEDAVQKEMQRREKGKKRKEEREERRRRGERGEGWIEGMPKASA
jgi:hypothetical protein